MSVLLKSELIHIHNSLSDLTDVVILLFNVTGIVKAETTTDKNTIDYPYTIFAESDENGAITINADNFCINGNIATNGTIVSSGNMNIIWK